MVKVKKPLVSIIIPAYNEESSIKRCIESLRKQTYKPTEIIVVDDGSNDLTLNILKNLKVRTFKQNHQGPGGARNLGASHASGVILVFVDADMTFSKNFLEDLTLPIRAGKVIGTFSKNEMNANAENIWSRCWNINRNWPIDRLIPPDYPNKAPVYRAIIKKEFQKVSGFDTSGEYTDDWSLSRKLGIQSVAAEDATYYHQNPASIKEVWSQARWIGKNEFISGTLLRRLKSIALYNPLSSILIAIYKTINSQEIRFVVFKVCYDLAILLSTLESFTNNKKFK